MDAHMRQILLPLIFCGVLVCSVSRAADSPSGGKPPPGTGRDFVALGVGLTPDYLGSSNYQTVPFGFASYRVGNQRYTWRGLAVKADFLELRSGGRWVGGITAAYVPGRHDVKNQAVDLLPEIAGSVDVGAFVGRRFSGLFNRGDGLSVSLGAVADVGGVYGGYTARVDFDYYSPISSRVRALINVGTDFASTGYMSTQFDVNAAGSAASGLPQFHAKSGFYQVSGSAGLNFQMNRRWGLFGQLAYTRLTGDASASPIVRIAGDADQWRVGLAVSYRLD